MLSRSRMIRRLRPFLREHPRLKGALRQGDRAFTRWHHALARHVPSLITPQPRQLTVAITAQCNLRCQGCRYGRDFMVGSSLSLDMMRGVLDDAAEAGINRVRLYGGEPMLHPDLPEMIRHAKGLGLDAYITTNATLLEKRVDELWEAGLRWMTIGFYGIGDKYDDYTQRRGHYDRLDAGLRAARERYGDELEMQLNFVIIGPTCTTEALAEAWAFAEEHGLFFHLDLYGYSMPFFTDGGSESLGFTEDDRERVQAVGDELVRLKQAHPERFPQSMELIRSVPDWLLLGPDMRVPCDAYQLVWIGADGTVQLCDVCFELGNLHENRLRDILFTEEHRRAAVEGFQLKCPNCTCKSNTRIMKHGPSVRRYGG